MLEALFLVLDGDFELPLYADPDIDDLDTEIVAQLATFVEEVAEGDRRAEGTDIYEEWILGYKVVARIGIAFCAVATDDVAATDLLRYLQGIAQLYGDEVDDPRNPDASGLGDLFLDVIPPWEE